MFLRLNALHGKRPWFDTVMILIAHGLVYPTVAVFFFWAWRVLPDAQFWFVASMGVVAYAVGYAATYCIGIVYRHKRPVRELPNIHLLVRTLGTWKSFPSDHAMTSAIPAILAALIGAPSWLTVILFFCFFAVGFSRVYVGVHYPRDIIGGLIVGAGSAIFAYSVLL